MNERNRVTYSLPSPRLQPTSCDAKRRPIRGRDQCTRRAGATGGGAGFGGAFRSPGHAAPGAMEPAGGLVGVITQNADRLHAAAGSRRVVELHGAIEDVRCLTCGAFEARTSVHERLLV